MAGGIGEGHGAGAAIDQAVDQHHVQAQREEVVQELLFDADELGEDVTGALDAPSPLSAMFTPRKRGRPPGSTNRMTKTLAAFLLSQHRHPVQVAMELYSCTPAELAEKIGLSKMRVEVQVGEGEAKETRLVQLEEYDNDTLIELLKLQVRMLEHSSKYVAQAMPQAVHLGGGADFTLNLQVGPGGVSFPARVAASEDPEGGEEASIQVRLPGKSDG